MRDVGDPELVRPLRDKLAIYQVSRTSQGIVANSCSTLATPCNALYSRLIHQVPTVQRATSSGTALV